MTDVTRKNTPRCLLKSFCDDGDILRVFMVVRVATVKKVSMVITVSIATTVSIIIMLSIATTVSMVTKVSAVSALIEVGFPHLCIRLSEGSRERSDPSTA